MTRWGVELQTGDYTCFRIRGLASQWQRTRSCFFWCFHRAPHEGYVFDPPLPSDVMDLVSRTKCINVNASTCLSTSCFLRSGRLFNNSFKVQGRQPQVAKPWPALRISLGACKDACCRSFVRGPIRAGLPDEAATVLQALGVHVRGMVWILLGLQDQNTLKRVSKP